MNVRTRSSLAHQGRLPAFVYARHDHLLLNKEIIRQGYWHTLVQFPGRLALFRSRAREFVL